MTAAERAHGEGVHSFESTDLSRQLVARVQKLYRAEPFGREERSAPGLIFTWKTLDKLLSARSEELFACECSNARHHSLDFDN
jgi:hypothetical protein